MHNSIHCLRSGPGQCPSSADLLASQAIPSTQTFQQTGNFNLPWRLSQPPESSAGQSAVDHLSEGPGHLSLQAATAGLEWKPGPEALLPVCPAVHINHQLHHQFAVLCIQSKGVYMTWDAVSHVDLFQCYSGTAWLWYPQGLMARCPLTLAHWPAGSLMIYTIVNPEVSRASMAQIEACNAKQTLSTCITWMPGLGLANRLKAQNQVMC